MKLFRMLVVLAVLSIGISSVLADTDVVRNSISSTGVGRIDYAMTYVPSASLVNPTVVVAAPVTTLVNAGGVLSAFVQGASISKATSINSYIFARADGGDFAASGLTVLGTDNPGDGPGFNGPGADASVTNYNMYGYVTNNIAYTGQYADSIQGESVQEWSKSLNNQMAAIPAQALVQPATTKADFLVVVNPSPFLGITSTAPFTGAYSSDFKGSGSTNPLTGVVVTGQDAGKPAYVANKLYQYSQAGGSKDSSKFPMGLWAQSVDAKGSQLAILGTGSVGDSIQNNNFAEYATGSFAATNAFTSITQTTTLTSPTASISPNFDCMGYADKNIVYSNKDTSLLGNSFVPAYTSYANTPLTGSSITDKADRKSVV